MLAFILNYIHWNPNPMLFETDFISISWYGFFYGFTIMVSYYLVIFLAERENKPTNNIADLFIYAFISGIVGARLIHVFFYDWSYFSKHLTEIPMIWKGGLASHGGVLGMSLAVWYFSLKNKAFPIAWLLDRLTIIICLGGALVRIGNLMNSEIYGKVTNVPWAFVFEQRSPLPRHPSQIYESLLTFSLFGFLLYLAVKYPKLSAYRMLGLFLIVGFSVRSLLEFFKEDGFMPQLLNMPFVLVGFMVLVYAYRKNDKNL